MIADWNQVSFINSPDRPKIVCLCGSTKFYDEFMKHNFLETMKGNIVLSVGFFGQSAGRWKGRDHGELIGITMSEKDDLDKLHKKKIDLCDEILVINVDGYIGESTISEIRHADKLGKIIRFIEPAYRNNYLIQGILR